VIHPEIRPILHGGLADTIGIPIINGQKPSIRGSVRVAPRRPALSANAHERLEFQRIDQQYRTLRTSIRCVLAGVACYFVFRAIGVLAGQTTSVFVNATLSLLADFKFVLSITLAGAMAAWAFLERAIRERKVAQMSARIAELEQKIDPGRSSSGLDPRGRTNPRDRRQ